MTPHEPTAASGERTHSPTCLYPQESGYYVWVPAKMPGHRKLDQKPADKHFYIFSARSPGFGHVTCPQG